MIYLKEKILKNIFKTIFEKNKVFSIVVIGEKKQNHIFKKYLAAIFKRKKQNYQFLKFKANNYQELIFQLTGHKEIGFFKSIKYLFDNLKIKSKNLFFEIDLEEDVSQIIKFLKVILPETYIISLVDYQNLSKIKQTKITKLKEIINLNKDNFNEETNLIVPGDNEKIIKLIKNLKAKITTYGINDKNLISAKNIKSKGQEVNFKLAYQSNIIPITLKIKDKNEVYAFLAASVVGINLDLNMLEISELFFNNNNQKNQ
jgi:hypothetical protein